MAFLDTYPVSLNELLVAPVIFRENVPLFQDLPFVTSGGMRDLAEFGGYKPGAVRTALSRLRAAGALDAFTDKDGTTRYRMNAVQRSVSRAVQGRSRRPDGFLLAVFSFATEDVKERQIIRDALKFHGFHKLAQNVYINGYIDTRELENVVRDHGLSNNLYLFRCKDIEDAALKKRLFQLFKINQRVKVLKRFHADLTAFLEEPGLSMEEFARRYFYSGPVHFRITFTEEPPLPARHLPPDYPLDALTIYMNNLARRNSRALVQYYRRVNA